MRWRGTSRPALPPRLVGRADEARVRHGRVEVLQREPLAGGRAAAGRSGRGRRPLGAPGLGPRSRSAPAVASRRPRRRRRGATALASGVGARPPRSAGCRARRAHAPRAATRSSRPATALPPPCPPARASGTARPRRTGRRRPARNGRPPASRSGPGALHGRPTSRTSVARPRPAALAPLRGEA